MVTLPPEFVETRLPGYFLNTDDMAVYSLKIDGVLKKLKFVRPNRWNRFRSGYQVSHKGQKRWLDSKYLESIVPHDSVIGVKNG